MRLQQRGQPTQSLLFMPGCQSFLQSLTASCAEHGTVQNMVHNGLMMTSLAHGSEHGDSSTRAEGTLAKQRRE